MGDITNATSGFPTQPPDPTSVPTINLPMPTQVAAPTSNAGYAPYDTLAEPPPGASNSFSSIPGGTLAKPAGSGAAGGAATGGNQYLNVGAIVALHIAEIYAATQQSQQRFLAQKVAIQGMDWNLEEGMEAAQQTLASGAADAQSHLAQAQADYVNGITSCINAGTALASFAVTTAGESYQNRGKDEAPDDAQEEADSIAQRFKEQNDPDVDAADNIQEGAGGTRPITETEVEKAQTRADAIKAQAEQNANAVRQKWNNIGQMISQVSQGLTGAASSFTGSNVQIEQAAIALIKAQADAAKQIASAFQSLAQQMQQDFSGMAGNAEDSVKSILAALNGFNDSRNWIGAA